LFHLIFGCFFKLLATADESRNHTKNVHAYFDGVALGRGSMPKTSSIAEMPQNTYLGKVKKLLLHRRILRWVTNAINEIWVLKTPPQP